MAGTVFRSLGEIRAALGDEAASFTDEALLKAVAESTGKPLGYIADSLGYDPGSGSMWGERASSAIDRYQSGLYDFMGTKVGRAVLGLPSMVSRAMPGDPLGTFMDSRREANDIQAQVAAERAQGLGAVDSYKDVDWLSPSSVGNYVGGLGVQSAPYLAEAFVGGVVGRGLMTGSRDALMAARFSGDVEAAANATRALRAGSTAGAVGASYPSSVGDIMSNMREESGFVDENAALGLGIPYAAANAFGLEGLAARGVLPRAINLLDRPGGLGGAALRATVGGVGTAASEGFNETLQEFTNQLGRQAVNPSAELFGADALERYKESFIGGAMLGQAGHTTLGGWRRSEGYKPQVDLLQGETPDAPAAPPLALGWNGVGPNSQAMSAGYGPDATVYPAGVDPRYAYGPQGALFASDQQPEQILPEPVQPAERSLANEFPGLATPDDLFSNTPTALVRTEFSAPTILRELSQATGQRPNAYMARAANALATVLETASPAAIEEWIGRAASRSTNPDTLNTLTALADIASRYQSRMVDAMAQEGRARAAPGAYVESGRVGDPGTGSEQQVRDWNVDFRAQKLADVNAQRFEQALQSVDADVASRNEQTVVAARAAVLDEVLGDPETRNPMGRFTAELKKRGLPNIGVLPQEVARIERYEAAKEAYTGGGEVVSRGGLLAPTTAAPATATVGTPAQAGTSPVTPIQAAPAATSAAPPLGPDTPSPTRSVPTAVIPQVAKPVIEQVAPTPPAPVPVAPPAAPRSRTPASSANPAPGGAAPTTQTQPAASEPARPSPVAFWNDNPGGSWLESERRMAAKASMPTSGSPTYGTEGTVALPPSMLAALPGRNDEHKPGPNQRGKGEKAAKIRQSFDDGATGITEPIFVQVGYDGKAYINEGNNRLAVALERGLPTVPVRVQYHAGGELQDGPMSPDKVRAAAAAPAARPALKAVAPTAAAKEAAAPDANAKYDGLAVEIPVAANGKSGKIKFKDAGKTLRQMDDKISKLEALRKCLM